MALKSKKIKKSSGHGGPRHGAGRPAKNPRGPENRSFEESAPSYDRQTVYLTSIEAKKELPAWDRGRLRDHSRWLVNNSGIATRIVRGIARYSVANGLVPQARTANLNWNKNTEELFEDRVATDAFAFDKSASVNFYESQRLIVEQMICDGEFFAQLTASQAGNAMCRFISSEYVGSRIGDERAGWRDGVLLNTDNRPTDYRVFEDPYNRSSKFTDVSANDLIHIRKLHRFGFPRGVPWLCSSSNRIQDLREMIENEQLSAKLNSKIAITIESPDAGNIGLGAGMRKMRAIRPPGGTDPNCPPGSGGGPGGSHQEESLTFDRLTSGVGTVQLKTGETLKAHSFDRPNSNFPDWTEFVIREIAWSTGMSPELLWNMSGVGGAVTRHILQDAEVFFAEIRQILEYQYCRRFWRYWVWNAIKLGDLEYPGDDWWRCDWIAPQRLTVDTGRDGALRLNLVRSGLLSEKRYFSELGQDDENETDDIIRGYARKKKRVAEIAQEEGVELSVQEVFPPPPGSVPLRVKDTPDPMEPE